MHLRCFVNQQRVLWCHQHEVCPEGEKAYVNAADMSVGVLDQCRRLLSSHVSLSFNSKKIDTTAVHPSLEIYVLLEKLCTVILLPKQPSDALLAAIAALVHRGIHANPILQVLSKAIAKKTLGCHEAAQWVPSSHVLTLYLSKHTSRVHHWSLLQRRCDLGVSA
uniref:Uncharacterized protein n=1 Tax=Ditylenchus dipsaci TaxID=166011 RepID=A0A915CYC7_9BILA